MAARSAAVTPARANKSKGDGEDGDDLKRARSACLMMIRRAAGYRTRIFQPQLQVASATAARAVKDRRRRVGRRRVGGPGRGGPGRVARRCCGSGLGTLADPSQVAIEAGCCDRPRSGRIL